MPTALNEIEQKSTETGPSIKNEPISQSANAQILYINILVYV